MEETTRQICFPIDTQSPDIKLATLLLATIQEAKDRIKETKDRVYQIEYVFLAQLYPLLQSKSETLQKFQDEWKSKEASLLLLIETLRAENELTSEENRSLKLGREKMFREKEGIINQLRDEVTGLQLRSDELGQTLDHKSKEADEGMELRSKLLQEVELKDSVIVSKEKQLKESEESRNVLYAKVSDLEKRADEVKQNLFKKIELQASEIVNNEKLLKYREEEKKLMLAKLKNVEENVSQLQKELLTKNEEVEDCAREKKLLLRKMTGLEEKVTELQGDLRGRAGEAAKRRGSTENLHQQVESITTDLLTERKKYGELTAAYKSLKSQHIYLRSKYGLTQENMLPHNKLEDESDLLRNDQNPSTFHDLEDKNQHASPAACNIKKMKNEISFNNNLNEGKVQKPIQATSPFSSTSVSPKCPSTVKSAPVAGRKRSASSWIDTRSRQGQNGTDPHDDFLDTPIENVRANLHRSTKEKVTDLPVPVQNDSNLGSSDDETQDVTADHPRLPKQHMPVTVAGKNGFKYVEPVRKRAERENLKGVECKQCKKFYDAVLPDDGGKDNDNNKHDFRCEHHEGVSRHRGDVASHIGDVREPIQSLFRLKSMRVSQ
ncbi:protein gamma response 1 isoform X1 [Rosa chinensis]|uniref:protein gamma response 1 isoform X1 n=1 Tax=Rosa chinensis TaxID=74649 RepID=UPI001AD8C403|nr:protein gamma response 1 isoform X1 [Rosa chinensis]